MREFSLPALYEVPADSNLTDLIRSNATRHPSRAVISRKTAGAWQDVTAAEFLAQVRSVAKGLIASGVRPGDRVGLMSPTRYEWTLFDFAVWTAGGVSVPIYETSSAEQVEWILNDSGAVGCMVADASHEAAVESVRERLPQLKNVWQLEAGAVEQLVRAGEDIADGTVDERTAIARADSPASIVYTSGTTGRPKGCVLTHRNLLAETGNTVERLRTLFHEDASVLLFLPLAHVLGRMVEICAMLAPIRLGHVSDVKQLQGELASFRPTLVVAVPRVFEKVYNGARAKAEADGKGRIFDLAANCAMEYSRALDTPSGPGLLLRLKHRLFDKLVYGKLRAALGGLATHAVSGGGPLGERLGHFYRGIGFVVLEGYGLTESFGATTFNPLERQKIGTVGQPIPGSGVGIAEDGEVLLSGGHLFSGYWNNPSATEEVFDGDWFRTGDLGQLDEDGYLRLTGRKKEIIVTAGGKNVAPAVIEDRIRAHALIAECMVVGEGRPFVGALITLDEEFLGRWAEQRGKAGRGAAELRGDPELLAAVQAAVDDGNSGVSRAEAVKKFRVLDAQFSEEGGHLTPSLKLKRHLVLKDFSDEIEAIYR
ncbi:AMP-dependent synthetase/ligase [Streptomyces capparidis]